MTELLILILITLLLMRRDDYVTGGAEQKYYYHGSSTKLSILKPMPSRVIEGDSAVFATSNFIDAVIFSAQWTDYNFGMGRHNGKLYLCECYPDAFDKLSGKAYIHYLPAEKFHSDMRLGLRGEFICKYSVKPIKVKTVDILKYLRKANINMIKYSDLLNSVCSMPKIPLVPKKYIPAVKIYVPLDPGWRPNLAGRILYFNDLTYKQMTFKLRAGPAILVGDIFMPPDAIYDYTDIETVVLEPTGYEYTGSSKTSFTEYQKYLKARRKLFTKLGLRIISINSLDTHLVLADSDTRKHVLDSTTNTSL